MRHTTLIALAGAHLALCAPAHAVTLAITDPAGQPLATVMVRERPAAGPGLDTADNGYPAPGVPHTVIPEATHFSDAAGRIEWMNQGMDFEHTSFV